MIITYTIDAVQPNRTFVVAELFLRPSFLIFEIQKRILPLKTKSAQPLGNFWATFDQQLLRT